ncbi:MAG: ABC transporter ATP-binding protein [Lachnospiraceae bacterium]|nr:ABC transporter ATP-binding protein [Lachnospiraceae bacterium]
MSLLSVRELNIEFYDHDRPERVVRDVSFEMEEGDVLGIVGESGSGKSMTALAIAGLLNRHDMRKSGRIEYMGKDLLTIPREELRKFQGNDISMIFQEPMTSFDPRLRVGTQVEEPLRVHRPEMSDYEMREAAVRTLASVGLDDPEKAYSLYPHELSGGMRQRAMIAAAIITEPRILIADEPTTALDVTVQAQIIRLLEKINMDSHMAILFISHDMSLVRKLCRDVLVMRKGVVVESGRSEKVYSEPENEYTVSLMNAIPKKGARSYRPEDNDLSEGDIVEVDGLNVYAGRRKQRRLIVKDASFSVRSGEIVGLVGESGSGKTTLGKAILGINKDVTGHVHCNDPYPQMIFQDPYSSLNPARNVGWILEEPLKLRSGLDRSQRRDRVLEMLETVGLSPDIYHRFPNELSGGQRQRIAIAGALMQTPKLVIADEPVSALDVTVQAQILSLIRELKEKYFLTVIFISHDLRVVYSLCDRVLIMKDGVIVEQGDTDDIYGSPSHPYTRNLLDSSD